jgi:radical SAM superfamily enzyme YgiQ (UPF0313 family)
MKIFVLNPPFLKMFSRESRSPAVTKSGTIYYPMWLAYTVGYLEKNGHEVLFIDAPPKELFLDDLGKKAGQFQPGLIVLGSSTPSIYNDVQVACALKKTVPQAFTILVGVHVSAVPEQTLKEAPEGLDAVAIHEYDATILELADLLDKNPRSDELLKKVSGIVFKNSGGQIVHNPERQFLENLDDFPFVSAVYKKHLDITPYFYMHSRHPIMVILTGRGCPFHCIYCVIPQTLSGHQYRKRSVQNIVEEFIYIRDNFPEVKEIMIEDDTLTADKKRCREFSQALIDAKAATIPWSANSRADVDYETMRLMKKANCRLFCVGFESGDQQILDNIKKAITLDKIREFRKNARRTGILVHGCFMVGNIGETNGTLEKTLQFAKELNPDTAQFYPIMVYPGTEAYNYFNEKGWITSTNYREWIDDQGLHSSVVSNPDLTYEQLVSFCDRCRREFYLRPRYIIMKLAQIVTNPGEAKRTFKAFAAGYKFLFHLK